MFRSFVILSVLQSTAAVQLSLVGGAGLNEAAYVKLRAALKQTLEGSLQGTELCVGHSSEGAEAILQSASQGNCDVGVIALGAAPSPERLDGVRARMLFIAGDLDGVVPFSHFAVAKHRSSGVEGRHFAVLRGASHMSFASGQPSEAVAAVDLQPELSEDAAHAGIAELVHDFLRLGGASLAAAELRATELAGPVLEALLLEGSTALGKPACNSDFPTNPTCQYPKFPDHSMPFGPAPAPSPPLPSDCICGSPWVADTATPMAYGLPSPVTIKSKDAFQEMKDTHPFHLPHIFNECDKPDSSCVLNGTTVTEPVLKPGALWPATAKSKPLSAYELKSKLKSKQAVWQQAKQPGASPDLDKSMKTCSSINAAALDWALKHADAEVLERFKKSGEPLVMVDDVVAPVGMHGPTFIANELNYTRVANSTSPTGTQVTVQSWTFVVANTNEGHVPWFFPVGMHYCKFLSPARAMEWIYTDSLRKPAVTTVMV